MTGGILYIAFSIFIFNFHNGLALPHEYCLRRLNTSDCGKSPTPVFTYYKPGSRCDVSFWRGCPTTNKFNDEAICSHYCIGKLWGGIDINSNKLVEEFDIPAHPCSNPIDPQEDCGVAPTNVYTYNGVSCELVVWRGCFTLNKFEDYDTCAKRCQPTLEEWKEEIEALDIEIIKKLDEFLNEVVKKVKEEIPDMEVVTENASTVELEEPTTEEPSQSSDSSGQASSVEIL